MTLRSFMFVAAQVLLVFSAPLAAASIAHDLVPITRFAIDRHEVTIGQFRRFVSATGLVTKAERDGGGRQYRSRWEKMQGWTWQRPYGVPASDDMPVAHVTFDEARAYCLWAGMRLPTDAEWLEAAYTERRSNPPEPFATGRTYPFPTGETASGSNGTHEATLPVLHSADTIRELGQGRGAIQVRLSKAGVNGLYDMAGNLWEWVDHDSSGQKRTRGGSWWYGSAQMRADAIYDKPADFPAVYIGFRCATNI